MSVLSALFCLSRNSLYFRTRPGTIMQVFAEVLKIGQLRSCYKTRRLVTTSTPTGNKQKKKAQTFKKCFFQIIPSTDRPSNCVCSCCKTTSWDSKPEAIYLKSGSRLEYSVSLVNGCLPHPKTLSVNTEKEICIRS